jgi:dTDP-4-dehydrorhamnose reductase
MKIAVTGAGGQLGGAFHDYLSRKNFKFRSFSRAEWDICSSQQTEKWLKNDAFDLLINCAAYTDVEKAESDAAACFAINAEGPGTLAQACAQTNTTLVHFSTDYVFDGNQGSAYREDDPTNPINVYGESKLQGETIIRKIKCPYFIFRVSWLFGGKGAGFLSKVRQWMRQTTSLRITDDEISSPTYCHHVPDAVFSVIQGAKKGSTFHLANQGCCSRFEWVKHYLESLPDQSIHIERASGVAFQTQAKRPNNSSLNIEKVSSFLPKPMPNWMEATTEYASLELSPG